MSITYFSVVGIFLGRVTQTSIVAISCPTVSLSRDTKQFKDSWSDLFPAPIM